MPDIPTDWLHDDKHIFLGGNTGGGKTCVGRQLHDQTHRDASLFINTLHLNSRTIPGRKVRNIHELANQLKQGRRTFHIEPHWEEDKKRAEFSQLITFMYQTPLDWTVTIDEAHQYGRAQEKGTPLNRILQTGRNHGCKVISITQTPREISSHAHDRAKWYVWVGTYSATEKKYLDDKEFPIEEIDKNGDHTVALFDAKFNVRARFNAKDKYVH